MPTVFANSTKYLCSQNMNHLYVIFDKKKKSLPAEMITPRNTGLKGIMFTFNDTQQNILSKIHNRLSRKLKLKVITWLQVKTAGLITNVQLTSN